MGFLNRIMGGKSSSNQVIEKWIEEGATLIDVRTKEEFLSGSAKGAKNIPLDQIASKSKDLSKENQIIVFCRSGNRSAQAKSILNQQGFDNVTNGGTWQDVNNLIK